jgi:hypothetical protein
MYYLYISFILNSFSRYYLNELLILKILTWKLFIEIDLLTIVIIYKTISSV